MANRSMAAYIGGSIVACWTAIAIIVGIFQMLAHFLKNDSAAIAIFLGIFYSCAFGFLGWQSWKLKGKRDGWPIARSFRFLPRRFRAQRSRAAIEMKVEEESSVSKSLLVKTTLTTKERERLNRLRRRYEWLQHRIANHRGDPGFDKSEASALEWAIRFIEDVTAW